MTLLSFVLLLTGCSQPDATCDSNEFICDTAAFWDRKRAETANPPDPIDGTWIEIIRKPGCNGDPEVWTYSARVHGPNNGEAIVDIWSTEEVSGFNEAHPLTTSETGDGWVEMSAQMRDDSSPQQYQPGQFTTYTCGQTDIGPGLTFTLRVYGVNGGLADCAIWTHRVDADAAISDVMNGAASEPNMVRDRDQITPDNCRIWTAPGG